MEDARPLLARLLNSPDLARVVPRLPPEVLLRVIERCGLEDCAELVALATPGQLARVLDSDLWRARSAGADEAFDADRFGTWIDVLEQAGVDVAAGIVASLDVETIAVGLAGHVAVFDPIAVSEFTTLDGERLQHRALGGERTAEVGGYVAEARRSSAWDAIVALLEHLASDHAPYFGRLMRRCVRLSNDGFEADASHHVLGERDQQMYDVAAERRARRDREGYVAPAEAQAFLQSARRLAVEGDRPATDPLWHAHRRDFEIPIADDAGDVESAAENGGPRPRAGAAHATHHVGTGSGGTIDVLRETGVLASQPRGLLEAGATGTIRLPHLDAHVESHLESAGELAFLANVLVAGAAVLGRGLTPREAADAAAATSNLGLERWPRGWPDADLVTAFRVGWAILHVEVGMRSAEALLAVLRDIECGDRDLQFRLLSLERTLARHVRDQAPWRAQESLDVILSLDAPSWAALAAMMGSCPVLHAALGARDASLRRIDPDRFDFVARGEQLAAVREFLATLSSRLTG